MTCSLDTSQPPNLATPVFAGGLINKVTMVMQMEVIYSLGNMDSIPLSSFSFRHWLLSTQPVHIRDKH